MPNVLILLDKIRAIATEGLLYASDPFDKARYDLLMHIASETYSEHTNIDSVAIRNILLREKGCITPKLGIVVVVQDEEGQVLVMQRTDDELWCFPCGWVDVGEGITAGAIREVFEETGLSISLEGMIGAMTKGPQEGNTLLFHQANIIVLSKPILQSARIRLSLEHREYEWLKPPVYKKWHPGHDSINNFMGNIEDLICVPTFDINGSRV